MRISQRKEEGAKENIDLAPYLKDYYQKHVADGSFVSWICLENHQIIATSGISFVKKLPYFDCPTGKIGLLSKIIEKLKGPDGPFFLEFFLSFFFYS